MIAGKDGEAEASVLNYRSLRHSQASYDYRTDTACQEKIDNGKLSDNCDAGRFTDFSGSWSKCLPHTSLGIVNRASWLSLSHALQTGRFSDFLNIQLGNPGDSGFSSLAAEACADLNSMSYIQSRNNVEFPYPVTPQNLFRGQIVPGDGSVQGT